MFNKVKNMCKCDGVREDVGGRDEGKWGVGGRKEKELITMYVPRLAKRIPS